MNPASNGSLRPAKHHNAHPVWYSSFKKIVKHMKRNPIFGLLGDPDFSQIQAKRQKTAHRWKL